MFMATVQNICNLIGREVYHNGSNVPSVSILYLFTEKKKTFDFRDGKNRNLLIKTKLIIIINYKLLLYTCNLFITNNYLLITNQK